MAEPCGDGKQNGIFQPPPDFQCFPNGLGVKLAACCEPLHKECENAGTWTHEPAYGACDR